FVRGRATHPWLYPLFCFVGHTGCRRSEAVRILISDVDFQGRTVLIREKKRSRKQRTTRRVPLTAFLAGVLQDWLQEHPGGYHLLRHSFISICASKGVDQRLIDEWVGHQTEEQRKRYRHLLPSAQLEAIDSAFA